MLREPGSDLDREVARRLGEGGASALPYSTDSRAADGLIARLEGLKIFAACEQSASLWYCTLSADVASTRERLATGTGKTRSLALCRAVLNLPVERLQPARPPAAT